MKKKFLFFAKSLFLLAAAAVLFAPGLAGAGKQEGPHIVWPGPPQKARIEFVRNIQAPRDMLIKKGFLAKIWGWITGARKRDMIMPFGVFADAGGRLYVTDTGMKSVHVFDPKDNKYFTIEGTKIQRFASPIDVAADGQGNIYVSDSILRAVFVFNRKGKFLREIGNGGALERPTGIAIDPATGDLYIVDTLAGTVLVYGPEGRYIKTIGGGKRFHSPTFLAIGADGDIYLSDSLDAKVLILDKNGRTIGKLGGRGDRPGDLANPRGVALDSEGHIYITDTLFNSVTIYDKKGRCLLVFGRQGTGAGEFSIPAGIYIVKNDIYVADAYNMRVQLFRLLSGK